MSDDLIQFVNVSDDKGANTNRGGFIVQYISFFSSAGEGNGITLKYV